MDQPVPFTPARYAFVLKLTDQPGGMEVVAATFANRGVSLECSLGNDGSLDPEGRATIIVTFAATPAKKEAIRRALGRLSRVRSLHEHPMDSPSLRKTAVFRVADRAVEAVAPGGGSRLEQIGRDEVAGESVWLLVGPPPEVDKLLADLRRGGGLREVSTTVIGL